MRSRGFAFVCLILLFGWGCYEFYRALYEHFEIRIEVPDPSMDLGRPQRAPDQSTSQYAISIADGTLVRVGGKAEQTDGGIEAAFIFGPWEATRDQIIAAQAANTIGTPQTQPETTITRTQRLDQLKTAATLAEDARWIQSNPDTGVRIFVLDPTLPPDTNIPATDPRRWLEISNPITSIVPAEAWFTPETNRQINGSGLPIMAIVAAFMFVIVFSLVWRTAYGKWASNILIETDQELNKVHWPTRNLVFNSAVIVVLCALGFGVLMFVADMLLKFLIQDLLQLW